MKAAIILIALVVTAVYGFRTDTNCEDQNICEIINSATEKKATPLSNDPGFYHDLRPQFADLISKVGWNKFIGFVEREDPKVRIIVDRTNRSQTILEFSKPARTFHLFFLPLSEILVIKIKLGSDQYELIDARILKIVF